MKRYFIGDDEWPSRQPVGVVMAYTAGVYWSTAYQTIRSDILMR